MVPKLTEVAAPKRPRSPVSTEKGKSGFRGFKHEFGERQKVERGERERT